MLFHRPLDEGRVVVLRRIERLLHLLLRDEHLDRVVERLRAVLPEPHVVDPVLVRALDELRVHARDVAGADRAHLIQVLGVADEARRLGHRVHEPLGRLAVPVDRLRLGVHGGAEADEVAATNQEPGALHLVEHPGQIRFPDRHRVDIAGVEEGGHSRGRGVDPVDGRLRQAVLSRDLHEVHVVHRAERGPDFLPLEVGDRRDPRVRVGNDAQHVVVGGLREGPTHVADDGPHVQAALERGLNVRAIVGYVGGSFAKATDDNMLGIIAHPDSGITSIADLKGKKVGTTFGSMNDMYLVEVSRKNGLSESAINRINSTPAAMTALFDTGNVDAMAVWEPYLTRMLDKVKGARLLVRGGDLVCFCAAMHAKPETVYRDREATQRLVNAMAEAARFVRDPKNLDEIGAIGARYIPGMDAELIKRTHKYWVYDMRLGKNSAKAFNDAVQVLIAQKKMKQPFDPLKYYDTSFIERAMKEHPEWFNDLPGER